MPRISAPTQEAAPAASQPQLAAVKKQLGVVPNMFRTIAHSQALSGRGIERALCQSTIEAEATFESCGGYCQAAHSYLGKTLAKLSESEIDANRRGRSSDAKADAAVRFAASIVTARGHVGEADLSSVRAAGFTDSDIIEIVAHVALNTLTNFVNEVAGTSVDFPSAAALKAA